MRKFLMKLGFALIATCGISAPGAAFAEDVLPWPWGSECPFPWASIEGEWAVKGSQTSDRFVFSVKKRYADGTKVLAVTHASGSGQVLAVGEGVSPRGERIVKAHLHYGDNQQAEEYWALVRTYIGKEVKQCRRATMVTVITLRLVDNPKLEVHYIIEKVSDSAKRVRARRP